MAPVVPQHFDQPVIESANFDDGDEGLLALGAAPRELIEEVEDLLRMGRDLASQVDVAVLVAQEDGQLSGVLVDSEKEHAAVLHFRDGGKAPHWDFHRALAISLSSISKGAALALIKAAGGFEQAKATLATIEQIRAAF